MTIQEMKQKKKELGYTNEMVSALSGVPLGTVQKVFAGATSHPRYETLQALERAFEDGKHNPESMGEEKVQYNADKISEAVTAYQVKKQGEYTVDDLSLIHISEPTRRVVISYAVFCLKKFFFNDTATTEIYTRLVVGSVRCV